MTAARESRSAVARPSFPVLGAAALAGAATVFAFAPFEVALLPIASLATLFASWRVMPGARPAAWIGFAFGVGLFGVGVSWVFIALSTFGGMPWWLGAIATAGFVAYLALWPALAGAVVARFASPNRLAFVLLAAATWTACEWLRGYVLTGFPWLAVGYASLPGSTLAGYAPIGGVFLVSLATAACAALVAVLVEALAGSARGPALVSVATVVALFVAGSLLRPIAWTAPQRDPLAVSLVQGDVAQAQKFDETFRERTFALYAELVERSKGRLVVLPESAFPMFADEIPEDVLQNLAAAVRSRDGDVLIGMFTAEPPLPGSRDPRYYNTVVALGTDAIQLYRKHHLVPFGETIPLKAVVGWFIHNVLAIPLADQTPGAANQPQLHVAGHRVAMNICYEDVFGAELIDAARGADILINVTNDAWYGHSVAAWQHNQIAAMRALELGRPLLRATNTGITSAIDTDGAVLAQLPWYTRGVLEVEVRGRTGFTPYLRFGDLPVLVLIATMLGAALLLRWRAIRGPSAGRESPGPR